MRLSKKITGIFATAVVSLAIGAGAVSAEEPSYPTRPVKVVVGFAPGGGTDTVARFVAEALGKLWKQSVVVENRPGAGGQIAEGYAAKANGDGYTLLADSASLTINPALRKSLPYKMSDFVPISLMSSSPYVLVINPQVQAKSVKELIALAKQKPGELSYASAGVGSSLHLAGELFKSMAGVDIVHVPYQGADGITDLISGRVQMAFAGLPQALPQIKAGKLVALGVSTPTRSPLLPDVPTIAEAGVPGFEVISWYGLLAPAKTPKPIVDKISADVATVLKDKDIKDRFLALGLEPVGTSSDEFAGHIKSEVEKWDGVVKKAGITAD
ncbi:tripartite tricarboxylate transporter substrate binding protein [Rhizobium sp. P32RR-XVIII]|uniref:Bug family tripartite tricarboxylate transporter substrate binding protein n=1 Tax=Rhizobium sp. P32RR-XVIII TaxID=2726738 RepID=UPI00145778CC|nr:tripartite tricarboxylate transporter substrate binding protein [Rhizobium sp. P32RR-XVIII]NLS06084.1 tripartite tricarboxylate transporter substrate binding protein [Rhizobium sp. P32RR-XVIII]